MPVRTSAGETHSTCKGCGMFEYCRSPFMGGHGVEVKPFLVVGEAPTQDEDFKGTPFLSKAAGILRSAMKEAGIPLSLVRFTNSVRCHPQGGKIKGTKPIKACREFLVEEIEKVKPRAILLLGAKALLSLLNLNGVTEARNRVHEYVTPSGRKIPVIVALHPASTFHQDNLPHFKADMRFFSAAIGHGKEAALDKKDVFSRADIVVNPSIPELRAFQKKVKEGRIPIAFDYESMTVALHKIRREDLYVWCVVFSSKEKSYVLQLDKLGAKRFEVGNTNTNAARAQYVNIMAEILTDPDIPKVGHNVKYDATLAYKRYGVTVNNLYSDTLVMHSFIWPVTSEHDLEQVGTELLGIQTYTHDLNPYLRKNYKAWEILEIFKGNLEAACEYTKQHPDAFSNTDRVVYINKGLKYGLVPWPIMSRYCGADGYVTIHSHHRMEKKMEKMDSLWRRDTGKRENKIAIGFAIIRPSLTYCKIVMPACRSLLDMELAGANIDLDEVARIGDELRLQMDQVYEDIPRLKMVRRFSKLKQREYMLFLAKKRMEAMLAGKKYRGPGEVVRNRNLAKCMFNPGSGDHLREILFSPKFYGLDEDGMPRTDTGLISTDIGTLNKVLLPRLGGEPKVLLHAIVEHRKVGKMLSTYVDSTLKVLGLDGCIHTNYNLGVARTGRLSSTKPNTQNYPARGEWHKVRAFFIAKNKKNSLLEHDYSQIELRILAAISKDKTMCSVFANNGDIHAETCRTIFGLGKNDEQTEDQRREAKAVNFGVVYGESAFGLSRNLEIPMEDAESFIDAYFSRYPGVKAWIDEIQAFAASHGYVYTMTGRRRLLPDATIDASDRDSFMLKMGALRQAVNTPIQGTASDFVLMSLNKMRRELKKLPYYCVPFLTVHDSIVTEVATRNAAHAAKVIQEIMMAEPIRIIGGAFNNVPIRADVKIGKDWHNMEKLEA